MPSLRRRLHSLLARRTVETERTVIIWWGIVPWGATIGDLRAVEHLSGELARRNHPHSIISHPDYGFPGHVPVADLSTVRRGIETIVFVCGPLVGSGKLDMFLAEHPRARKLAAGVSVLPNQAAIARRFDAIVARDGVTPSYFDLAIRETVPPAAPPLGKRLTVGLCLRGKQRDVGVGAALFEEAERMMRGLAARLDADILPIDTRIRSGNTADRIEAELRSIDLMLTTRLHGSLFALALGKPVIALDQVVGTAKVMAVLDRVRWPYAYGIERSSEEDLAQALDSILDGWPTDRIARSQKLALELSRAAVGKSADLIVGRSA